MLSDSTLRAVRQFASEREWEQFHAPANLAKSISIEASELLECYQWSDHPRDPQHVADELADVLTYCIHLARVLNLDLDTIVLDKLVRSAEKYPVGVARGNTHKHDAR